MKFTLEKIYRAYNDNDGDFIEVRPDADSLRLVEIGDSETKNRIVMLPGQARIVAQALLQIADDLEHDA